MPHHRLPDQTSLPIDGLGHHYVIATDGACKSNPNGTGGWGGVLQLRENETIQRQKPYAGQELFTTNNRMEMTAVIKGLSFTAEMLFPVVILSDSEILVKGATEWLEGWKAKGWKGSKGAVKNVDLWEQIDGLTLHRDVHWLWVRGHNGHDLNEMADTLASNAALGRYLDAGKSVKRQHPTWFW